MQKVKVIYDNTFEHSYLVRLFLVLYSNVSPVYSTVLECDTNHHHRTQIHFPAQRIKQFPV